MTRLCLWVVGLVLVPTLGFGQQVIFRADVQPGIQGVQPPMPGMPPRDPTQPAKTGTATLRGHAQEVWCLAFTPDSKLLATASATW